MGKKEDAFDKKLQKIVNNPKDYKLPTEKETDMKISNTKKIVFTTIASTLFVLGVLAGTFYLGTQYESNRNKVIAAEAAQLVEQLKSQSK